MELSKQLERTETELRTQAFRLAALEAAFAARAAAGPILQRNAGGLPMEAESVLVLS